MAFEVRSRTENVLHSAPFPPPFPLTSPPSHWRLGSYCLYGNVGNQGSDTPRGQRPIPKILLNSLPTPFPKQVSRTCFLKSHTHTGILVQQDRLGCSDRSTQGWIYSQNTRVGSLSNQPRWFVLWKKSSGLQKNTDNRIRVSFIHQVQN